ncbi:MAG: hypothetical protein ACE5HW_07660, partial [Candidatus Methanofastidiosia archaeon]
MSNSIETLRSGVKGLKALFLIEEGEIKFSDFDENLTGKLKTLFSYLIEVLKEKKRFRKFRKMWFESEDGNFFLFVHENILLGISAEKELNVPLLELLVGKLFVLHEVEVRPEKESDIEKRTK